MTHAAYQVNILLSSKRFWRVYFSPTHYINTLLCFLLVINSFTLNIRILMLFRNGVVCVCSVKLQGSYWNSCFSAPPTTMVSRLGAQEGGSRCICSHLYFLFFSRCQMQSRHLINTYWMNGGCLVKSYWGQILTFPNSNETCSLQMKLKSAFTKLIGIFHLWLKCSAGADLFCPAVFSCSFFW